MVEWLLVSAWTVVHGLVPFNILHYYSFRINLYIYCFQGRIQKILYVKEITEKRANRKKKKKHIDFHNLYVVFINFELWVGASAPRPLCLVPPWLFFPKVVWFQNSIPNFSRLLCLPNLTTFRLILINHQIECKEINVFYWRHISNPYILGN